MQRSFIILSISLVLAGCGQTTTALYYKQGMTIPSKQKDYDACKIKSFKEIPQNIVTEFHPGVNNPGTLSCNTIGTFTNCSRVGALNIPASTSSHDANDGMRERFIDGCMKAKGYKFVELKDCGLGEEGYNAEDKAPALNKVKCYDILSPTIDE